MPLDDTVKQRFVDELYEALETSEPIDPLTSDHELTVADAYEVQSAFIDRRIEAGAEVTGHKIGLTSDGIQEQLGVDEPDFGQLLDEMFVVGRSIPGEDLIAPRIEPEIGFVLGDDLETPVTYYDVLLSTEAVVPVIEVIDSRIRDWDIEITDTIADNASAGLYLTGEQFTDTSGLDLSLEGVKVFKNGKLVDAGVGANVLDHPARSVAWLANTLGEMDEALSAGSLVLSGSATPAVDVESGDVITAEFATIGSLTCSVE